MKKLLPFVVLGAVGVVIYYLFGGSKNLYAAPQQTVPSTKPRVSYPPVVSSNNNNAVFPIQPNFWSLN